MKRTIDRTASHNAGLSLCWTFSRVMANKGHWSLVYLFCQPMSKRSFEDVRSRRDGHAKESLFVCLRNVFMSRVYARNARGEHIRDYTNGDELRGVPQSVCSPPSHRGILLVCGRPSSTEELAMCSTKRSGIFFPSGWSSSGLCEMEVLQEETWVASTLHYHRYQDTIKQWIKWKQCIIPHNHHRYRIKPEENALHEKLQSHSMTRRNTNDE